MAEPTEIAGKVVGKAREAAAAVTGHKGIFRKLKEEHGEITAMLLRVKSSNDADTIRDVLPKLRGEFFSHMIGEEEEFYPVLQEFEDLKQFADTSVDDHRKLKTLLDKLSTIEVLGADWKNTVEEIEQLTMAHVKQEEKEIFPKLEEHIDDARAEDIEKRFMKVKERELGSLRH